MLVIVRINYGQNLDIVRIVGTISLCGLGGGLWSAEGGDWKMDAGLTDQAKVSLHLHKDVASISLKERNMK